ncbi:hypothetical protein NG99_23275 [Erwinia typographi]|uniref:Uncharacterized protein n=1 Tax=Erwinia typographi TaxID=371042 RepID=A0A0A3YPM2_9GAMM|nr:hypothetical protein NG99_23275 [Erwinia typographi]
MYRLSAGGITNASTVEDHINDLLFDSRLPCFVAIGELEYVATGPTPETLALSRAEAMSINFTGMAAGDNEQSR